MKKLFSFLLIFFTYVSTAQINIDTVKINFHIDSIVDITSLVPQLNGSIKTEIKDKINADIKTYFSASSIKDSATYVSELLKEYDLKTVDEYLKFRQENPDRDSYDESFTISLFTDNLLNIGFSSQLLPHRGQYMFFYNSVIYDLKTGNKLKFNDFFRIHESIFNDIFKKNGYYIEQLNIPDTSFKIVPLPIDDEYIQGNIKDLFSANPDESCIEFYFSQKEDGIHLLFKFKCAGPALQDYGIALKHLASYIIYPDFKYFGKDIHSLNGTDYSTLGKKIQFNDYTVTNSESGYLIAENKNDSNGKFGITYMYSLTSVFYVLIKFEKENGVTGKTILDILEIKRRDLNPDKKITEYCETRNGFDSEVFALVKDDKIDPEYYTVILKAWRANRNTGKFEIVDRKKLKRCGNESFGL